MQNPLLTKLAGLSPQQLSEFVAGLEGDDLRDVELLTESLSEFIPRISPALESPRHLQPLIDLIEQTEVEPQNAAVSTPPQHGKSQTGLHGLIWLLGRDPTKRHAYVTYEATRAERHNEMLQGLADRAGLKWKGNRSLWRTPQGGGIVAAGIGGPLTGEPVDGVMLIDDPVKNFVDASSSLMRERADEWFKTVAVTRCHPSASIIVVQTRWHADDLSGRLIKRGDVRRLNLPAINPKGEALWPKGRPLDFLLKVQRKVGDYVWGALYQGDPRPRGGALFGDVRHAPPPIKGFRIGIGVDCAYTKKTSSDYSVAVVLAECEGIYYVLAVHRMQEKVPVFKARLDGLLKLHPGANTRWYTSTTEAGLADMIGIHPKLAREDKFVRAQPVVAAWNAGKVMLPTEAPWLEDFVTEIVSFTGVNDAHDDQVDALAAAFDALEDGDFSEDLDKYQGPTPRFGGQSSQASLDPEASWQRPTSSNSDTDKLKRSGRW